MVGRVSRSTILVCLSFTPFHPKLAFDHLCGI